MTQPGYALVTGASRGLGRCFARTLAARKRNLVLVARSGEKLERLARELRTAHGIQVESVPFDLALNGAGQRLADELTRRGLEIDLLVNNAGFGDQGRFLQLSLERQLQAINLQNATVVELTHRLLPAMIEAKAERYHNRLFHGGVSADPICLSLFRHESISDDLLPGTRSRTEALWRARGNRLSGTASGCAGRRRERKRTKEVSRRRTDT